MTTGSLRLIPTTTHGRYCVLPPSRPGPAPILVGFHGYAEAAETQLDRLQAIPGADRWVRVSVLGLHRFYRGRTGEVVASWMTRQDREQAIADNQAYTATVIDAVACEWNAAPGLVCAGFSQGVAMAFRAACAHSRGPSGVIALGGDVPPELTPETLSRLSSVLLGRGRRDVAYSTETWEADATRLREARVAVRTVEPDAAHEWTAEFNEFAGAFLSEWG